MKEGWMQNFLKGIQKVAKARNKGRDNKKR